MKFDFSCCKKNFVDISPSSTHCAFALILTPSILGSLRVCNFLFASFNSSSFKSPACPGHDENLGIGDSQLHVAVSGNTLGHFTIRAGLRLKNASHWSKVCERCDLGVIEDLKHITMQCPFYEEHRISMYREIAQLHCDEINVAMENPQDIYPLILGKQPDNVSIEDMLHLCTITGKWITTIYDSVIIR